MSAHLRTRAIRLDAIGPPENLRLVQRELAPLASGQIRIRTAFAGLIYGDAEARRGTYYKETTLPWYPGREVAGTVEAVGEDVRGFKLGDRVAALVFNGGCYADLVLARLADADVIALPESVSFSQALVYFINFRLAHLLLHAWAKMPPGARILVHGAAGGMGTMILQQAKAMNCESIALVRTEAEAEFVGRIGATHVINTSIQDYIQEVLSLTGDAGVAFSFNGVGGETLARDPFVLQPFGELHVYGYVAGKTPINPFAIDRTIAIKTFNADDFLRTPHFQAATEAVLAWFAHGPLIDAGEVFPLAEAAAAHRALEEGRVLGKILLRP